MSRSRTSRVAAEEIMTMWPTPAPTAASMAVTKWRSLIGPLSVLGDWAMRNRPAIEAARQAFEAGASHG